VIDWFGSGLRDIQNQELSCPFFEATRPEKRIVYFFDNNFFSLQLPRDSFYYYLF